MLTELPPEMQLDARPRADEAAPAEDTRPGTSSTSVMDSLWDSSRPIMMRVQLPLPSPRMSRERRKAHQQSVMDVVFGPGQLGLLLAEHQRSIGGVLVASVAPNGQGAAAGVLPLSVVVAIDGKDVSGLSRRRLLERLANAPRPLTMQLRPPPEEPNDLNETQTLSLSGRGRIGAISPRRMLAGVGTGAVAFGKAAGKEAVAFGKVAGKELHAGIRPHHTYLKEARAARVTEEARQERQQGALVSL